MKKMRYSEEQIVGVLNETDAGILGIGDCMCCSRESDWWRITSGQQRGYEVRQEKWTPRVEVK